MTSRKEDIPISGRFAENLRRLVSKTGNVTNVAKALDISRAQFNRYLSGEAHPRPAVLKRICDHFGVDARILTDILPDDFIAILPPPGTVRPLSPQNYGLENAMHYLPPAQNIFTPQEALPDGLYLYWRSSMAMPGTYACTAIRLASLPGSRVFRSYIIRNPMLVTQNLSRKERELRGFVLSVRDGFAWLFVHSPPWNNVSMVYSARPGHQYSPYMPGFFALARNEKLELPRLARAMIEKLPARRSSIIRAAHATGFYRLEELPEAVRLELHKPVG